MRQRRRVLIGVNLALLASVLALHWASSPGVAQDQPRGRGSYLMVGGEIQGGNSNAIYVLDTANEELVALRWNQSRSQLELLGFSDTRRDADQEAGR